MNSLRGFRDIISPEADIFSRIEKNARELFRLYAYNEIRIPILELRELFIKSTGDTTDIVEKEMYAFTDAGKRNVALRPEGTPGIARAYIQHKLNLSGKSSKFFYVGNMFRAERPQAGRYREFEQIGIEYLGNPSPFADAETINVAVKLLEKTGAKDFFAEINSLGCGDCRKKYREILLRYLSARANELCEWCQRRIEKNPLRALDCKTDGQKIAAHAPKMELCKDCSDHFDNVQKLLEISKTKFRVNKSLVRGLDYYTRTVFEIKTAALGSHDTIAAGGRYDNLIKSMGGPDTPAVGWALGVDRLAMLVKDDFPSNSDTDVFAVCAHETAGAELFKISNDLINDGISVNFADFNLSLRSQMRSANKSGAPLALILGEEELKNSSCSIKFLKHDGPSADGGLGGQETVPLSGLAEKIRTILKKE